GIVKKTIAAARTERSDMRKVSDRQTFPRLHQLPLMRPSDHAALTRISRRNLRSQVGRQMVAAWSEFAALPVPAGIGAQAPAAALHDDRLHAVVEADALEVVH